MHMVAIITEDITVFLPTINMAKTIFNAVESSSYMFYESLIVLPEAEIAASNSSSSISIHLAIIPNKGPVFCINMFLSLI